ncbi:uncharacterized protein LOC122061767 isoform X1 [Macadamia integrifolia]|uniref:uncharacterized protein LOC122061767 isoform X1 n=1 Tax=Macadamia integrifolia TaxID=60698 RepID=UPI001C52E2A1|nr:uncharacterized protein LOC122061767 isoform X1 [Macadamia integrifolia]
MSDELFGKEADAKTIYLKASQRQAQLWYKKAKQKWMKDGDRNFKYFHLSVKIRRAHNQIRSLQKEDGSWIFDQQALKSYISSYYESFHGAAQLTPHWKLLDNIPQVLGDGENDILLAVPSKDEITKAVWDLDPDSSPGPDGFSGVEIFKGRVSQKHLLPMVDKIKTKLAGWKGKLLSLAGRVELVRSVISSLPIHNFEVYW